MHGTGQRIEPNVDIDHAPQRGGERRDADGGVPGVTYQDGVGTQQVGVVRDERLQPPGALLLRSLADQPDPAPEVAVHLLEGTQRRQVHDDVALAVRRSTAVPASGLLGQLEHRCPPPVLAERRLHVVVAVQQHRRCSVRSRRVTVHRVAAVRGRGHGDVLEPDLGERVDDPLRRALAFLWRELLRVGDRLEGDQLGQVGFRASHEAADGLAKISRHRRGFPSKAKS